MKGSNKPSIVLGLFIVFTIVFLIALGPYFKLQQISTIGLLPFLAAISFLYDAKTLHEGKKEFVIFLIMFILSFSTIFVYIGYEEFINGLSSFFGAIISAYIAIGLTKETNYGNYFHMGYIFAIIFLFLIMVEKGNISTSFASAIDYRDRFMLNANAYSYFCVFGNFSLFYLYLKFKNKILLILLLILPILFLVIAFTTQSRAGLLLLLFINLSFWLFVNKNETSNSIKKIFRSIVIIGVLVFGSIQLVKIYEGSRIQNRVVKTVNEKDSREVLFKEGLETFADNSLFGVGLGQFPFYSKYHLFTHNSYSEILAEQGIFGGILLFALFLIPSHRSIVNYRRDPKNPIYRLYLLFFIVFLIYNNAYVFYKFPFSMMYFFLMICLQKRDSEIIESKKAIHVYN